MVHNVNVSAKEATDWIEDRRNTPYRILVNKHGSALGCIIYMGEK